jgi:hypothetical protein
MTLVALPLAFVPAGGYLALRAFLRAYPFASGEVTIQFLLRGLKVGAISAAALPTYYILGVSLMESSLLPPHHFLAKLLFLVLAAAGNGVNLFAIFDCLRERGGASLLVAFLLALLQLCWMWTGFAAALG